MKQYVCLGDQPWSPIPTRTQQLLARLRDAQVLYLEPSTPQGSLTHINGARRVRPNILAYTLPSISDIDIIHKLHVNRSQRKLANFINAKLEHHHFRNPVLWVTHPNQVYMLDYLSYQGLIYDCDTFRPISMAKQEGALALAADVIFAASPGLVDHLSPCNPNIALIPNGVNYPMFCRTDLDLPSSLANLSGPVLGWTGNITPKLDLAPLEYAAAEHPGWTFVLAGEVENNPRLPFLQELTNVMLLGPRPMTELPDYLGRFDICLHLLPTGEEGSDVIPTCIYQYLSTGKPIVSMLFPDQVEEFPDVIYSAHTPEEFSLLCERALTENPDWVAQRRRDYGQAASWTTRVTEVVRILQSIGLY